MTEAADAVSRSDLLQLTAELVDIPSVSKSETQMADRVQALLAEAAHLETARFGDNVLARTNLGRPMRLLLAGHLDTVPPNGNERAVVEGDACHGLGAADMKGGVAVMVEITRQVVDPPVDITFIGYVCEEIEQQFSGLREIDDVAPAWLVADAAILGEPTAAVVEAGCQGVLRLDIELKGTRAHTARPWMGVNAIHRLGGLLSAVSAYEPRTPVIDGCKFHEALQAVSVEGGVANNVVPDVARVVLSHRFAPDREADEAFGAVSQLCSPFLDAELGDKIELTSVALAASPGLDHPLLERLVAAAGSTPRAKLGWTDVSFFSHRGVPAANFGPGEPTLAHTAGEMVGRGDLERAYSVLHRLVTAAA